MQIQRARPYADLPIIGRLAVALLCFEQACRARGVRSLHVETFLDYLWEFPALEQNAFGNWLERQPSLVDAGLGDPFPPDLEDHLAAVHFSVDDFRSLVANVTEIVHGSLYGAVENRQSLLHLEHVLRLCDGLSITPPPPEKFAPSSFAECHGWGDKVSSTQRDKWRASST